MSETPKCDAAIAAALNLTCPHCGVGGGRHFLDCPTQTAISRAYTAYREARKDRERWHGKFAIVVQENNALRKSNRALRVALANLQIEANCNLIEALSPKESDAECSRIFKNILSKSTCNCPRCGGGPPEPPLFEEENPDVTTP